MTEKTRTVHQIVRTQPVSKDCLVCGTDNLLGIKARFYETTEGELLARFTLEKQHQSYPGIAHGGISAAILDETIGRAIMISHDQMTFGLTAELQVRYRKPVPMGVELTVIGRIDKDQGRLFEGSGELYLPDGSVAIEAQGRFVKRRIDQITDSDFTETSWQLPAGETPDAISIFQCNILS